MAEKKKSVVVKTVICIVVMAVLVVGYYWYISNKDFKSQNSKDKEQTELEALLIRDLEEDYPKNPREVIIYYSDLICRVYNGELTEDQFQTIIVQLRTLFDVELLEQNTLKEYTENLKEDRESYRSQNKTIASYQVSKNSEVLFQKMDSQNYATLTGYYRIKIKKKSSGTIYEEFLLREDKDGKWRILGWELSNGKSVEQ